ncbi:MAG: T9SS type A sorting domain-containing protein [Reichenbachiella sp.]|uniref:T9SS type A sorting domain-containing protein n=1 Tax=Reichenbachiella sp. TaxID=2184521 RepID=UPI00329908DF
MKRIIIIALIGVLTWSEWTVAQDQGSTSMTEQGVNEELNSKQLLEIYPNPTSEYLNISQQQFDGSISQLEIVDLSGHTIYKVTERFTQLSIFVGNWQKGIYMVFFRQGNTEVKHKIVVQ